MKGQSRFVPSRSRELSTADADALAVSVLASIVADPDRLGRFLAQTGLDPGTIRRAASEPGFLPSVMDYLAGDETLLVAVAAELEVRPERLMQARERLSPTSDGTE